VWDPLVYSIKCILTRDRSTAALHIMVTTTNTLQTWGATLAVKFQGHSSSQTPHGFGNSYSMFVRQVRQLRGSKGPRSVRHGAENHFILPKLHDTADTYKLHVYASVSAIYVKIVRISMSCLSRKYITVYYTFSGTCKPV
jgi:hypothetical protein